MKKSSLSLVAALFAGAVAVLPVRAGVTIQSPGNVVGSGDQAWSYLVVEGEDYDSKQNESLETGFTRVDSSGSVTNSQGNPVLGPNTTASRKGALYTQTTFAEHVDKVTYKVQFAKAGTYYLYMRFTMFENGGNLTHYLNEDSFFVPPDFGKDPQTDWPLPRGGYAEGCCDGGFLTIKDETGTPVSHSAGDEAGRAYWEGNFHWNELISSQFNNPETTGEPRYRFKYEVKAEQVGKPLDFTISYREGGLTIDLFLFSTSPGLMDKYKQEELDLLLVDNGKIVTKQEASDVVGTGDAAWSYLILEGEDYVSKQNESLTTGFTRVDNSGSVTNSQGNPVLGPNTTASQKGALFTQTTFAEHVDKVTYKVQFAKAGTYYLYMRFTMFENGGNLTHYLNEDSFFVPPDFGKDPQTDWPLPRGGYAEGCCDGGFLTIKDETGTPISHSAGDEAGRAYWEGKFHWNELLSSQFNNPETTGEPRHRFQYEVKPDQVGKPLEFTISYREGGITIDLFLFSTNPGLMDKYSQAELDQILVPDAGPKIAIQNASDVVGTGADAWSYLILEGENYNTKLNDNPAAGFTRVDNSGSVTNSQGNPVLGPNTTASKQGALFTQTIFAEHSDKVTYQVQFAKPGTYYLYMRFTMFENGGNLAHYLNEDSFFVPPDFGKDPQTDWPLPRGGYTEGCCDGGFLTIKDETGTPVSHSAGDEAGRAYWEGNFHWNELLSSQFNNPETTGEPRHRFQYVVKADQVGKPLDFTISYREGGITIDLFLFSTNPGLMDKYSQANLDQILLGLGASSARPKLAVKVSGKNAVLSWQADSAGYVLESSAAVTGAAWSAVAGAPVVNAGQNTVTVDAAVGARYYRLKKP